MNQADFIRDEKADSLKHFQRIKENIIDPVEKLYSKNLNDFQIEAWVEDLAEFSNNELKEAVKILRQNKTYFPKLSEAMSACQSARKQRYSKDGYAKTGEGYITVQQKWQEREENIRRMVDSYIQHFKNTSAIYPEALRGKYEKSLLTYIDAVAFVQAQMIEGGGNGIGWSSINIFGCVGTPTPEEVALFFQNQRQLCSAGVIDVPIPTGKIREWKRKNGAI
ncbi:hypothetical protein [uncultured Paraglaciecola sp.]|uniref:hypothetical protein n=1 Tax=uncultured Paraglaciecola sp. TaxID=1765024 RepID=UPI002622161C|nr:hypothetical protein [uncultured Paraglaciecola sp.]